MEFVNEHIIPISTACLLVSACHLNGFFAYVFVTSFIILGVSVNFKVVSFLNRINIFNKLGNAAQYLGNQFVSMLRTLHNNYWVRVVLYVFIAYIVATTWLMFKYHVDVFKYIESTIRFVLSIPAYLYDIPKLIESIHVWLNSIIVLSQVTSVMRSYWNYHMNLIIDRPFVGLGSTAVGTMVLFAPVIAYSKYNSIRDSDDSDSDDPDGPNNQPRRRSRVRRD